MRQVKARSVAVALAISLVALPGMAQFPVNVLQDCWTTEPAAVGFDPESEGYTFPADSPVTFVWKHKLIGTNEACFNYVVSIYGFSCQPGKTRPNGVAWKFENIQYGEVPPDPNVPERLLTFTAPAGSIPPGRWDWALLVECNDSGNGIALGPDGDIDDECGVNVGTPPVVQGPLILGPEPVEFFDPHPGGFPPGRGPGEEGTTRPWCFDVRPVEQDLLVCACKDGTSHTICADVDCADINGLLLACTPACMNNGGIGGADCVGTCTP